MKKKKQKQHYNDLIHKYEDHYDGKYSQIYRDRFINKYLFKGLNIKNKTVLEAMCGSGQTTRYLLSKGALVIGNDISDVAMERFKNRWPRCEVNCSSLLETGLEDKSVDFVIIVGGLHHLHPDINPAIDEINRILKSGGYFCFCEPHAGSFPDFIRKVWYKKDKYFENNEESVDLENLKRINSSRFRVLNESYKGNLAYLFVLNSMIFRIPIFIKNLISPITILIEYLISPFQGKYLSCFVVTQWQKK